MTTQVSSNMSPQRDLPALMDDTRVIRRIFDHIDNQTTDLGQDVWVEPVSNYQSQDRLEAELNLIRRRFVVFCPSLSLAKTGDYVARTSAGVPLIAVRGEDGTVGVFKNTCRHRGVKLADGHGCKRALTCPYHGWTYGLDGQLMNIPHENGFPDVDVNTMGLVPVSSQEIDGFIYVCQIPSDDAASQMESIPSLIPDEYDLIETSQVDVAANWKIHIESSLEGYHIRALHTRTFYPRQYDNLTVVETFGENNRIAFTYQSIEKLRNMPQKEWSTNGCLTYVYHLFPNVIVSTFPDCMQVVILEPIGLELTRQHIYLLGRDAVDEAGAPNAIRQSILDGQAFAKTGALEDLSVVISAQQGLKSGANEYLTFGLFESAIRNLHVHLRDQIE